MVNNSIVETSGPSGQWNIETGGPNWPDTLKTRVGPSGQRYCRPLRVYLGERYCQDFGWSTDLALTTNQLSTIQAPVIKITQDTDWVFGML